VQKALSFHHRFPALRWLIARSWIFALMQVFAWNPSVAAPVEIPSDIGIRPRMNRIQFPDREGANRLNERLRRVRSLGLRIVHLGDSHVQFGSYTEGLRDRLQHTYGNAGFGLVFPYSAARTYTPAGYSTEHEGEWECAKSRRVPPQLPLGVVGMTCRTTDPAASFTIQMKRAPKADSRRLRIFCARNAEPMTLGIEADGKLIKAVIPAAAEDDPVFIEAILPRAARQLTIRPLEGLGPEAPFEIRGVSIERVGPGGVQVHTAGVGASRYWALLHMAHMEAELAALQADIVVIDFGTNDYLYYDTIEPGLEQVIRDSVAKIRAAVPQALIILTSAQDLYFKKVHVTSGRDFAALVRRIAFEEKVAFWDWFWVAGGPKSLPRWQEEGYARTDGVHLTPKGYYLKGELLAEALVVSLKWMEKHPRAKRLEILQPTQKKRPKADASKPSKASATKPRGNYQIHVVSVGESLWTISRRYNVTVEQLKQWNGLKRTTLFPGTKLKVYPSR
jgi:LysM repeat protein